jgi:lactate racemase
MHFDIRQGDETLGVEIADPRSVGRFKGPTAKNAPPPDALVKNALDSPTDDAPLLRKAVVPGDRVTIALDSSLPSLEKIVAPIIEELSAGSVEAADFSLLLTPGATGSQKASLEQAFPEADVAVHDPADADQLAYLASTKDGRRIYLNRRAVEADFLLLVGRAAADPLLGRRGPASVLFPLLADAPAMERARTFATDVRATTAMVVDRQGSAEAAWLAGVLFGVSVACDRNETPSHAWFGMLKAIDAKSEATLKPLWTPEPPTREPDLVVVSLSKRVRPDPWESAAAAAFQALSHSPGSPALLLVTSMDENPGESVRWLASSEEWSERQARFRSPEGRKADDVVAAAQFAEVLASSNVFLASKLEPGVVEPLGISAVDGRRELQTSAARSKSIWVVEDADAIW